MVDIFVTLFGDFVKRHHHEFITQFGDSPNSSPTKHLRVIHRVSAINHIQVFYCLGKHCLDSHPPFPTLCQLLPANLHSLRVWVNLIFLSLLTEVPGLTDLFLLWKLPGCIPELRILPTLIKINLIWKINHILKYSSSRRMLLVWDLLATSFLGALGAVDTGESLHFHDCTCQEGHPHLGLDHPMTIAVTKRWSEVRFTSGPILATTSSWRIA